MKIVFSKKYKTSYQGNFDAPLSQEISDLNMVVMPEPDHNQIQQQMRNALLAKKAKEELAAANALSNGEKLGPQLQQIQQFISAEKQSGKLGVNVDRLRSSSVGGIGTVNESQLQEIRQANFNMRNGGGEARALDDLSIVDARGNPVNYLLNPPEPLLSAD